MGATLDYDLKRAFSILTKENRWNVLCVLILHANIRNRCFPSMDTITKQGTNGNRFKATGAKQWLERHKAFEVVPYNKRVDEECRLKPRQHVYQLLGTIQHCEDAGCECQSIDLPLSYLYFNRSDGETSENSYGETFKSSTIETGSITSISKPKEVKDTAPNGAASRKSTSTAYPENVKRWKVAHLESYGIENLAGLADLMQAWAARKDVRCLYTELTRTEQRAYCEVHRELARVGIISFADYNGLVAYTRQQWKAAPLSRLLTYATSWKQERYPAKNGQKTVIVPDDTPEPERTPPPPEAIEAIRQLKASLLATDEAIYGRKKTD